jgi:undecaprenyl-diphosphatase
MVEYTQPVFDFTFHAGARDVNRMTLSKLMQLDYATSNRLRVPPGSGLAGKAAVFLAHSGDSWFWLAGLFIIWLAAGHEWHVRAAMLAGAIVAQACLVLAIKFSVRRSRPPGDWGAIYRNTDPHSFPSGHATRAVMLALMAWGLGPTWLAGTLTVWAPLVSLARVSLGVHYLSDVIAGALVGILLAWASLALQPLLMAWFPFVF